MLHIQLQLLFFHLKAYSPVAGHHPEIYGKEHGDLDSRSLEGPGYGLDKTHQAGFRHTVYGVKHLVRHTVYGVKHLVHKGIGFSASHAVQPVCIQVPASHFWYIQSGKNQQGKGQGAE